MARFLNLLSATLLNCAANSGRGDWVLDADLSFQSDVAKAYWIAQGKSESEAEALSVITAPKGFHTDYMSVPPEVPGVVSLSRSRRAGGVHDFLYSNPHQINDRETCDLILREMYLSDLIEAGVPDDDALHVEADAVFAGVRLGGASHWD